MSGVTVGATVSAYATRPEASLTWESLVANACCTCTAVPVTGNVRWFANGAPTVSPSDRNDDVTAAI